MTRFDTLAPHLGVFLIGLMAAVSVGLAFTRMDTAQLFRNCAIVQAFPVVMGLILTALQDGRPDMTYAAYGTFFAWFGLAAIVVSDEGLESVFGHARRA